MEATAAWGGRISIVNEQRDEIMEAGLDYTIPRQRRA